MTDKPKSKALTKQEAEDLKTAVHTAISDVINERLKEGVPDSIARTFESEPATAMTNLTKSLLAWKHCPACDSDNTDTHHARKSWECFECGLLWSHRNTEGQ